MPPASPVRHLAVSVALAVLTAGCTSGATDADEHSGAGEHAGHDAAEGAGHEHGPGEEHISQPVGDGTTAQEVGYSLTALRLPDRAGVAGDLSFVIEDFEGQPQTEFLAEQEKELHAYVVRDDYAVFRHVHPVLDDEGTWRSRLTLPEGGTYRLVVEFVAEDEGGRGDHLVLGDSAEVRGPSTPGSAPGNFNDGLGLTAFVSDEIPVGEETTVDAWITDAAGGPVSLGSYLGAAAHLTGFHEKTGATVHMHPHSEPVPDGDATRLGFHARLPEPGSYRLFLQVRVDGLLHTIPLSLLGR